MFRLYNASFKRLPDSDGLAYWIDNFSSGRNSIRVVASSFLGSAEFAERYGDNVSDSTYVNTLYKNVLGRDADAGGLNYWLGQLNSGAESRYEVLLGFSESAENKALFTEMTGLGKDRGIWYLAFKSKCKVFTSFKTRDFRLTCLKNKLLCLKKLD